MKNWLPLILIIIEKLLPILIDEIRKDEKKTYQNEENPTTDYPDNPLPDSPARDAL